MTRHRQILILYPDERAPAELGQLAAALATHGAEVTARPCLAPYDEILDAIESADSIVFWR